MKDQVDQLNQLDLPATLINSTISREQQRSRLERAIAGKIKLLYIAPERFQNEEFRDGLSRAKVSLFAVDEAHCVSFVGTRFQAGLFAAPPCCSRFEIAADSRSDSYGDSCRASRHPDSTWN